LIYRSGVSGQNAQLTWFDRQGKVLGLVGEPGPFYAGNVLSLSPDGSRLALSPFDALNQDIWLFDVARGVKTRFTVDPARDEVPVWSADGSRIAFSSNRGGHYDLYQKDSSGAGGETLLFQSGEDKHPTSWARDGRFLLYSSVDAKTKKKDVWVLPMDGGRKPFPFLRTGFNEFSASFSPDTRWIAYVSDQSGRNEIYVRPFSPPSAAGFSPAAPPWTVSQGGGVWPHWCADGKELVYADLDGKVMAVQVTASPVFHTGVPQPLFQAPNGYAGDVTADGKRFLLAAPLAQNATAPFTVVLNWTAGLNQ
jgi:Tol biopolymer transport system component